MSERECGSCTACCDGWVKMNIKGSDVFPGQPCPFSSERGCTDYDTRPVDPCVNFTCAWLKNNNTFPDWLKPSNSKMLLVLDKFTWMGHSVDLAVPVGKKIPPRSLQWVQQFSEVNNRPLLYTEQIIEKGKIVGDQQLVFGYGPPAFQQQVEEWQKEGKQLW